jgi:hypothetical protein
LTRKKTGYPQSDTLQRQRIDRDAEAAADGRAAIAKDGIGETKARAKLNRRPPLSAKREAGCNNLRFWTCIKLYFFGIISPGGLIRYGKHNP